MWRISRKRIEHLLLHIVHGSCILKRTQCFGLALCHLAMHMRSDCNGDNTKKLLFIDSQNKLKKLIRQAIYFSGTVTETFVQSGAMARISFCKRSAMPGNNAHPPMQIIFGSK